MFFHLSRVRCSKVTYNLVTMIYSNIADFNFNTKASDISSERQKTNHDQRTKDNHIDAALVFVWLKMNTRSSNKRHSSWHHVTCIKCYPVIWEMKTMWRLQRTEADIHDVMASVCAEASVDPWEEQRSRLKSSRRHYSLFFCNWKMGAISERGSVCEIISCLFFFLICLPQHVSMCHQSVTKKKKCIYGRPVHSAGKEVNQTVAASRAVKEKLKKRCNFCSDFYKTSYLPTTGVFTTLSTSRNWKNFFMLFKIMEPQKAILYKRKASLFGSKLNILHQFL